MTVTGASVTQASRGRHLRRPPGQYLPGTGFNFGTPFMLVKQVAKVTGVLVGLLTLSAQASASMLASFNWVDLSHSAGTMPIGSLTLTLPDTITTQTFDTGTLTQAQARSMLTGFAYTFSNGLSIGLADLTTFTFSLPVHWATSNADHGGFGTGVDLITGFQFSGSNRFQAIPARRSTTSRCQPGCPLTSPRRITS
jgi:hypothetical protein